MNRPLTAAAVLMGVTTLAHVFLGGQDVYRPLLGQTADPELALYVDLSWHFISVFLGLGTLGLVWAARAGDAGRALAVGIGLLCLGMAVLFAGAGLARMGEVWTAPQWTILGVMAALALWPHRSGA